jgi:hypothetical protein
MAAVRTLFVRRQPNTESLTQQRATGGAALGLQLAMELTDVVAAIPPAVLQIGHEWLE